MNEKHLCELIENLQFPLGVVNAQGDVTYINPCFVDLFGYTLDDIPNLDAWWPRACPDEGYRRWVLETWNATVTQARRSGRPIHSVEYRVTCKDGSMRYIEIAGVVLHDELLATFVDVTDRHGMQKLAAKVPGVMYQYQQWPDGRTAIPYASPGLLDVYGVAPEAVAEDATAVFRALHPDDLEHVVAGIKRSMDTLTTWHDVHRSVLPDGRVRWLEGESEPEPMPDGSVLWHGYILDITDARQREARLRTLIEMIPEPVWLKDPDGVYLACNAELERFFGAKEAEIVGKTDDAFVDEALADAFRANDEAAIAAGGPRINEEEVTYADDGHKAILETIKTPLYGPDGELLGVLGIARDITRRKQAERALEERDELLNEMGRVAKIGGWAFDVESGQGAWTDQVAEIHDMAPDAVTSRDIGLGFYRGESRAAIEKAIKEAIATAKPYDLELELVTAKGRGKWVRAIGHPVMEGDRVVRLRGSFQDITDRKQGEQALRSGEARLRAQLDELRRWQAVMLDREDRVLELKREVNALLVRLGEPPGYPSAADGPEGPAPSQGPAS